jgi:hypothetical protein
MGDDYLQQEVNKHGCEHVGVLPPEKFSCISCEDTAKDCNCLDGMGVYCAACGTTISIESEYIRQAYAKHITKQT